MHHCLLFLIEMQWRENNIVVYYSWHLTPTSATVKNLELFGISDNDINTSAYILNSIMFVIYWVLGLWWAAQVWIDPTNP